MNGYEFEKKITLGNVIQILVLSFALIGGYFGIKSNIDANTRAHETNASAILKMQSETKGLDVLVFKVDMNASALARIEKTINE